MATLSQKVVNLTGTDPVFVAASAGGDKVVPGAGSVLLVRNGGGSAVTVTLTTPEVVDSDLPVGDRAVSVPAAGERHIAVPSRYAAPSDGLAAVTYSAVTSVTVASTRAQLT